MRIAALANAAIIGTCATAQTPIADISIPAGPLAESLAALARQTGISVGYEGRLPSYRAAAVRGRMPAVAALRIVLAGSGLRAIPVGQRAFRLVMDRRALAIAPVPPTSPMTLPDLPEPDLIVTGTKRVQALSSLPLSLSVASLRADRAAGPVPGSAAVAERVEGLVLTNLGPGRNRPFIRGVADSPFNGASQSTVSIHLDDARITYNAPDPDLRLVDIDRVEILKGPQGPLYGTGALGGVYHIVTIRPDLGETTARMTTSGSLLSSGDAGGSIEGVLNLPLRNDDIGMRLVGYAASEPGWIGNGARQNANDGHVIGGRAALRMRVGEYWTVDLSGAVQLLKVDDSQYVLTAGEGLERPQRIAEPHDNDFYLLAGRVAGKLGDLDLLSATSWVHHNVNSRYDASAAAVAFAQPAPLAYDDDRIYSMFNQELRLSNGEANGLNWIGGLSFLSAITRTTGTLSPSNSGTGIPALATHQRATEVAAFGEVTLPLGRRIKATLGGRLFYSNIENERSETRATEAGSTRKTGLTPSLAVSWTATPHRFFYIRYASALRPGGLAAASSGAASDRFLSDELATIDLGTRLSFAQGALVLDGAVFLTRWDDIQADYLLDNGLVATRNAGEGRIPGMEATLRWRPGRHWTLEAGGTFQRPRLTRAQDNSRLGDDRRLPVVPDLAFRLGVSRAFSLGGWSGQASTTLRYTGSSRLSFDTDIDRRMGDYATAVVAASLQRGVWMLSARADNLFNARADSFAFGNPFSLRTEPQYTPLRPRMLTLSVSRQW